KVRDKTLMADARDELTGIMRRLRSLPPEKREDFSINEQQAFKSTLDGVKATIAIPIMLRSRARPQEKREDFSINEQQAFKSTLDGVKATIAIAGLFITGLSLFVGAIGIMNITFVSAKERTKEIGTRK